MRMFVLTLLTFKKVKLIFGHPVYRVMLIQYTIYTPLIAPGAILLPCKNCVSGAIKGVIYRECDFNILVSNAYFEV